MTALKSSKSKKINYTLISWKNVNLILIFSLIIIGAINLVFVNDMTAKSFEIRDLRRELSLISEENRKFETNLMALKSYDMIKTKIEELHLVSAYDIKHINTHDSSMARR